MKQRLNSRKLTAQETQLIRQLRRQPEMLSRLQSILDLAHAAAGPLKTADEVEALLIQELRQLGSITMHQWATQAEARVSAELQPQNATVRGLKKKSTDVVVRLWRGDRDRAPPAQPAPALPPPSPATWAWPRGPVAAAGAGADGLRL